MAGNKLHYIIKHCDINRKRTKNYTIWLEYMNLIMISKFKDTYIDERYTDTYTDRRIIISTTTKCVSDICCKSKTTEHLARIKL